MELREALLAFHTVIRPELAALYRRHLDARQRPNMPLTRDFLGRVEQDVFAAFSQGLVRSQEDLRKLALNSLQRLTQALFGENRT